MHEQRNGVFVDLDSEISCARIQLVTDLAIIIVNYNVCELLRNCLRSVYESKGNMEGIPIRVNLQKKDKTEYLTEIIGKVIKIDKQDFVLGQPGYNVAGGMGLAVIKQFNGLPAQIQTKFIVKGNVGQRHCNGFFIENFFE